MSAVTVGGSRQVQIALVFSIVLACPAHAGPPGGTQPGTEAKDIGIDHPLNALKQCICAQMICMPPEIRMALAIKKHLGGLKLATSMEVKAWSQGAPKWMDVTEACDWAANVGGETNEDADNAPIYLNAGGKLMDNVWWKKFVMCHEGQHATATVHGPARQKWVDHINQDGLIGNAGDTTINGLAPYEEVDADVVAVRKTLLETATPEDQADRAAKKAAMETAKAHLERELQHLCNALVQMVAAGVAAPTGTATDGARAKARCMFESCKKAGMQAHQDLCTAISQL